MSSVNSFVENARAERTANDINAKISTSLRIATELTIVVGTMLCLVGGAKEWLVEGCSWFDGGILGSHETHEQAPFWREDILLHQKSTTRFGEQSAVTLTPRDLAAYSPS